MFLDPPMSISYKNGTGVVLNPDVDFKMPLDIAINDSKEIFSSIN